MTVDPAVSGPCKLSFKRSLTGHLGRAFVGAVMAYSSIGCADPTPRPEPGPLPLSDKPLQRFISTEGRMAGIREVVHWKLAGALVVPTKQCESLLQAVAAATEAFRLRKSNWDPRTPDLPKLDHLVQATVIAVEPYVALVSIRKFASVAELQAFHSWDYASQVKLHRLQWSGAGGNFITHAGTIGWGGDTVLIVTTSASHPPFELSFIDRPSVDVTIAGFGLRFSHGADQSIKVRRSTGH